MILKCQSVNTAVKDVIRKRKQSLILYKIRVFLWKFFVEEYKIESMEIIEASCISGGDIINRGDLYGVR